MKTILKFFGYYDKQDIRNYDIEYMPINGKYFPRYKKKYMYFYNTVNLLISFEIKILFAFANTVKRQTKLKK